MLYGVLSWVIFLTIGILYDLYPIQKKNYSYLRTLFDCSIIRLVCSTFLAYFGTGFIFHFGISRLVIVFWFIISMMLILVVDTLFDMVTSSPPQTLLIINNSQNQEIIWSLQKFEQIKVILIPFQEDFHTTELLNLHKPNSVLVLGDIPNQALQYIADKVNIAWVDMLHVSEWMLLDDLNFQITRLWPILGLHYRTHNITERDAVIKRVFDIIWSVVGIIISSPIMLITAIALWIFDKWPIFYKHQRVGRNGVTFDYIKFRSMKVEYCTGSYFGSQESERYRKELQESELNVRKWELQKIKDDPRITKIGKFIRKYSIDELPSLRCVLKGDMSIVGPRPHLDFEVARYQPWMKKLLSVKPGITCYSQIYWRDRLPFSDEAKFDLYYIKNRSFLFDIYIIIATVQVLFKGR